MNRFSCVLTVLWLFSVSAVAIVDGHEYPFEDGSRAAMFKQLAEELRCPKCQNQNLADSNAMIASDLRRELYSQVKAGKSENEIVDFMVQRYGEFVLYRPAMSHMTVLLWFGPVILLMVALLILIAVIRKRKKETELAHCPDEISTVQQAKLDSLLNQDSSVSDSSVSDLSQNDRSKEK